MASLSLWAPPAAQNRKAEEPEEGDREREERKESTVLSPFSLSPSWAQPHTPGTLTCLRELQRELQGMKGNKTFKSNKILSETLLTQRIFPPQPVLCSPLELPSTGWVYFRSDTPSATGEGKEQLRESSKPFHQGFTSTVRALISFLHTNASFLLISHQLNIDPTQLLLGFCSCFSHHGLPWQNPPVLSMFSPSRAGGTKPKGHTWCPR